MKQENTHSVLIVGAGLSGLTAANDILLQYPNASVTVIQAMDRVGGRTCSVKLDGTYYDLGAQWIGPGQDLIKQLAIKSGNQFIQQYQSGTKVMQFYKNIQTYSSEIPTNVGIFGLLQLQLIMWKLDRLAKTVPLDDPNKCQNAIQWDSMTVATWIHKNIWIQRVKILIQVACRAVLCCQSNEVSFLFLLWYLHHNGGIDKVVNIKAGLQQTKMSFGTQHMSNYLQKQIEMKKGKIVLGQFVNIIQNLQNKCIVKTLSGKTFESDYIVIALPPCNVKKIKFFPDLSPARKMICNKNILGQCTKFILLYKEPYWRKKGFSGQVLTTCTQSPLFMAYDDCRPKQNGEMQYGMVVFITAGVLRQWLCKQNWQQKILEHLAKVFNEKQMLNPIKTIHKNWQQESSVEGSYAGYFPPGVLTQINDLRAPQGRVHWAGTQLALKNQGYMDGAIQSGQRVAKQILLRFKDHNNLPLKNQRKKQKSGYWYNKLMMGKM